MKKALDYMGLVAAMLLWGATYIWSKTVFGFYNPLETIFIRVLAATLTLSLWRHLFSARQTIAGQDRKLILLLSFLQPFLYFIGENYGLFYASATVAAVFIGIIPIVSMLLGKWFNKQPLGLGAICGALVSFIGVILVILSDNWSLELKALGGLGLLLAVLSGSCYGLLVIRLGGRYSAMTLVYLQNRNSLLFFTPLILLFNPDLFTKSPPFSVTVNLLALTLFGSVAAFALFNHGIASLGMAKAYSFSNLIPVFTAVFANLFLAERLNWYNMLGVLAVVCGLFLVNWRLDSGVNPSSRTIAPQP